MKLSVVILNYNVRYFLELCLKSVQAALSNIEAEIIVVDNNSDDDSCEMVKNSFPEVILIENKENLGFSKGNNIGVSKAKGEYICILNPDTVIAEDTFIKLLGFVKFKEKLGIVGCKLINGAGAFLPESKRNIPYVRYAIKKILGIPDKYYANHLGENDIGEVDVLVGAFMLIKRSLYFKIGGFDEDYFMYGEDIDLSYKALKYGYKNYYYGDTTIIHFKGESTLRDRFYAKRFYGAMQIFYKKHFKRNILFDSLVWLGIRLVYFFRRTPKGKLKQIDNYVLISDKKNNALEKALSKDLTTKLNLNDIDSKTEVIFDNNFLSYKRIIDFVKTKRQVENITYKILPKKSKFALGSDDAIHRGEVVIFE